MPKGASPGIVSLRRAGAGLALALAFAAPAFADVIYKWIDQDGKTQYGGQPPKNFSGEVIRIEVDVPVDPTPRPRARAAPDEAKKAAAPADIAAKRRELRNRLQANLERARAKLELAREQLADGAAPLDDERQVVQQRAEKGSPPPASGAMHGSAPRSNCRVVTASDGKATLICAAMVPNEAYRDRQQKLEEAVRQAEVEVDAAEQAYRRGVD